MEMDVAAAVVAVGWCVGGVPDEAETQREVRSITCLQSGWWCCSRQWFSTDINFRGESKHSFGRLCHQKWITPASGQTLRLPTIFL